ncbi:hypothetical protein HPB48_005088 [Haemaphysalis longicornis]|uniref:Cadherin domain-containing protein n=1 Tax=Haemaphysalis longicornis TaxID=44386 RepID=A0A9J6FGD2_HAELO|nr:hypothetical protein HPB48_005088 [Haemaphysalis longicornis]
MLNSRLGTLGVTKYIRIGIGDKNDNPPYFGQALYEAEVNEDEDVQHTVITVTAKDKDECGPLTHSVSLFPVVYIRTCCTERVTFLLSGAQRSWSTKCTCLRLGAADAFPEDEAACANHSSVVEAVRPKLGPGESERAEVRLAEI